MSTTSRTVQATPGFGQLVAIFAALLAGTALIVALAYGQLSASQSVSLAPAAAPAPAVAHDRGWSSTQVLTTPDTYARGWSSTQVLTTPDTYARGWISPSTGFVVRTNAFDKSHHAVTRSQRLEQTGG